MPGQSAHTQPAGLHQPGRRPTWTRVARYPVLALTVLVLGYLIFQVFTANVHSGSRIQQAGGTRVTLTARTVDAARPTAQVLTQAQQVIRARANRIGIPDIQVAVNGDNIVVTVPSDRAGDIDALVQTARLDLRPVISSVPEQPAPSVAPGAPPAPAGGATPPESTESAVPSDPRQDLAQRIAQEKKWRQSDSSYLQMVALQFQATRCGGPDVLAGNDDPQLPLITCATDAKAAYLLGPSIIDGAGIQDADAVQGGSGYLVNLQFNSKATAVWADYTAAHVGTQIAFTLDTRVLSAPVLNEAIPGGRTQLSGGDPPFTQATARRLATALTSGSLPVVFESSARETVAPQPGYRHPIVGLPPIAQTAPALVVLLLLLGALVYLYWPRSAARP
ncbi:hypothetical protein Mkiyose1665_05360 [Mycobacterium kiyosense]|nr:hypothetical protein IWGMT90018_31040 [Mycobacterium kiyosense]BDE14085.1 hypothetical protein MKCMC460_29450 [Mycobacterium sp. 20KCMC460]GLB88189.1 hypothetical protein SRL2020130_10060 [Mycobacterium kiyosense]GLB94495.1 hypothetical protein SRL2020226_12710 [Mycobacterium kiyosense]GLB99967.1 hypothetical protein SRL2020400_05590 [Mycobacterium kiyosense]